MKHSIIDELDRLEQERDRYKEALEDIVAHLETLTTGMSVFSTSYHIAKKALEGEK